MEGMLRKEYNTGECLSFPERKGRGDTVTEEKPMKKFLAGLLATMMLITMTVSALTVMEIGRAHV